MSSDCKIIMSLLEDYIKLKDDYKEYNEENEFDVYYIFESEVGELNDIVKSIMTKIDKKVLNGYSEVGATKETVIEQEEELLNEIADVLLTTARLIKEFKLVEPLTEMIEYKYHRQLTREEKIKNELLK